MTGGEYLYEMIGDWIDVTFLRWVKPRDWYEVPLGIYYVLSIVICYLVLVLFSDIFRSEFIKD